MKRILTVSLCIVALATIVRCTKKGSDASKNTATCTTCSSTLISHPPATPGGLFYYAPTGFTPNSDGVNDVFRIAYSDSINVDSSSITIWDLKGNGVFTSSINQAWQGTDLNGVKCPAGHYPYYLKLRTKAGEQINTCGCITILTYRGSAYIPAA